MSEFTGERVIPGLVDADLLNEHLARYRFALRFAAQLPDNARILDAGCGTGYGAAELSARVNVTAMDIASEAVTYAREKYSSAHLRFLQGSCEALPFADDVFDLITAFEVIEHLPKWQELLAGARRILKPSGILLVSTPNRSYYEESRGDAGPNPFHVHEFDHAEYKSALEAVFPHVRIWTQNHAAAIAFAPEKPGKNILDAAGGGDPANAHFYLAACSRSPIPEDSAFAWIPSSGNVLREREQHIAALETELAQKDAWLQQNISQHSALQRDHETLLAELERQNAWATSLDTEIKVRDERVRSLQAELEERLAWVASLEAEIESAKRAIADEQARMHALAVQHEELRSRQWVRAGAALGLVPRANNK